MLSFTVVGIVPHSISGRMSISSKVVRMVAGILVPSMSLPLLMVMTLAIALSTVASLFQERERKRDTHIFFIQK